jgi:hypothetical protein
MASEAFDAPPSPPTNPPAWRDWLEDLWFESWWLLLLIAGLILSVLANPLASWLTAWTGVHLPFANLIRGGVAAVFLYFTFALLVSGR